MNSPLLLESQGTSQGVYILFACLLMIGVLAAVQKRKRKSH